MPAPQDKEEGTMKRGILFAALAACALVACGGGSGAGSTPEDSFEAAKKVAADRDYAGMVDLISPSMLAKLEEQWKKGMEGPGAEMMAKMLDMSADEMKAMSFSEYMAAMMEKQAEKDPETVDAMKGATIKDKKVEGDRCTLTVTQADGKEEKVTLVREDGKWYLAGPGG
jgi:major membrane immunogen (membrane-anchored lipoprotein)